MLNTIGQRKNYLLWYLVLLQTKMGRPLHVLLLLCAPILITTSTSDIYSITLKDIEGNNVSMEDYKGKASLPNNKYVQWC